MKSFARNLIANMLLLVGTLLVTFLLCEIVVRLLFKDTVILTPRYHTAEVYEDITLRRTRSNLTFTHTTPDGSWEFSTNAQGFRNYNDFEYRKPPDSIRVVALGDSHTQGHECHQDYTYAAIIEKYLAVHGVKAEVLNTGVSGFSTAEALLLLEREMVRYQPDYVVLGFFANDYEDNLKSGFFELDDSGGLTLVKTEHIPGVKIQDFIYAIPGIQWLGENSYFYSLLFNTTWNFFKSQLAESAQQAAPTEFAISTKSTYSDYEVDLAAALSLRMQATAADAGAKFIFLDVPRDDGPNRYRSSVTEDLRQQIEGNVDKFVHSDVLGQYQGVGPIHVPNGGRHITEFTHTILGAEIGAYIVAQENRKETGKTRTD